jgi:YD repeat-containing protein
MQRAPEESLPSLPPGGRTARLDWDGDDYAIAVVDAAERVQERFTPLGRRYPGAGRLDWPRLSNGLTVQSPTRFSRQV